MHKKIRYQSVLFDILLIKEYRNLIRQDAHQATSSKSGSLKCYLPLIDISMQKNHSVLLGISPTPFYLGPPKKNSKCVRPPLFEQPPSKFWKTSLPLESMKLHFYYSTQK